MENKFYQLRYLPLFEKDLLDAVNYRNMGFQC